jgi:hypothetical protein
MKTKTGEDYSPGLVIIISDKKSKTSKIILKK